MGPMRVRILDVGCGAGILSEALARIGANVTGIDGSEQLIETAKKHASLDSNLSKNLSYSITSVEDHVADNKSEIYDAVVASEVIEHVSNKDIFVKYCAKALKPGGSIFITTLNKTIPSFLGGIVCAEYILRAIPIGTHEWSKFISPEDTQRLLDQHGCCTQLVHGVFFNPLTNTWNWTSSKNIFYALHAVKSET
ncbi:GSCOCG00013370001-RA-CDS [Cotesia congregata]|nr:GSCOCG00013370001-RA-CDS [Cotesia congregata]